MSTRSPAQLRTIAVLLTPAMLLATVAAAIGRPPSAPDRCYRLAFGAWSPPLEDDLYDPLPQQVQLRDEVHFARDSDTLWRATRSPTDSLRRIAYWRRHGRDTVVIVFPSWWSTGVTVRLPARGDSLNGQAEVYVDIVGIPVPRTSVMARSIDCAAFPTRISLSVEPPQN
jgi:hypothetical protein